MRPHALLSPIALICAICMLVSAAPAPRSYVNPVLYADYSDPDVIRVGDDYYLVASSFHFSPGIPVLQSKDLVHWRIIGHVLARLPFAPQYDMPGPFALTDNTSRPVDGTRYASGVWAPCIRHHDNLFYVYWPTPDEGVFMSRASDPAGPWSEPVAVIAQRGLEDPCPFWDDDGQAWLVHSRVGAGPLILHRMSADGTRVLDDGVTIVEDREALPVLEGPKLYKRDGWYYIWAPIGGVGSGPEVVLRSRAIEGPYEHRVVLRPNASVAGPHQGGYVETPSGQGWFVHFNQTGAFGRIVYLEPVQWRDDGWPVVGEHGADDEAGEPVSAYPAPEAPRHAPNWRLQESDEFSTPRLGLQWSWNHNPDNAAWSLRQRPGFLRLTAGQAEHLVTARNTLTQILQGPRMRMTARLDVAGMQNGQRGGLAMFGVRPSWIGVVRDGGRNRITLASAGVETPGAELSARTVDVRVDVGPEQTARYSYSLDGGRTFEAFGDAIPLANFSWWKGSRPALFSFTRAGAGPRGWIDVDWVRVEHPEAR
ncbi:MAG TPA: glycoside hydrolase 43 family protein [Caulobacterales bacterium]|nr:glycoside hydrolase 43 family protein [Caulobacterales bacterium]